MRWGRSLGRLGKRALGTGTRRDQLRDIVALVRPGHRETVKGEVLWERLRSCAHPDLYAAQLPADEVAGTDVVDRDWAVGHFLAEGARAGRRICALFNPGWYLEQLADRGRQLPDDVVPFFDWLTTGWDERIVPTPLFDEEFYREHHPGLSEPWLLRHYLTRGCYRPGFQPSPVGRHHPGGEDPAARDRHRPLLLREMLHRSAEFDLSRTSWLEEGCVAALRRYAALRSGPMQELLAKAAAIEPQVTKTDPRRRRVSCPPHRHPRLYLSEQVEALRVGIGRTRADTVVLVPAAGSGPELRRGLRLAVELRSTEPGSEVLVVGTDAPAAAPATDTDGVPVVDMVRYAEGLGADQELAMLVDLVRGLGCRRVVVAGSRRGQDLLSTYGRQLSLEAELVEHDPSPAPPSRAT
jgi:hypothetical protein